MQTKTALLDGLRAWLDAVLPATTSYEVRGNENLNVPPGTIRFNVEFGVSAATVNYPVVMPLDLVALWNSGDRTHNVLSALYADAYVEPYITWASELQWRVTPEGKKAGLK